MRVTTSMYYKNMDINNNRVNKQLFDVNKQISSGMQIQYAYEDTDTFIETMNLDNEITTLTQARKSSESALKYSTNTDTTMNEYDTILRDFKVKLIAAANAAVQSPQSREAIAQELQSMRDHLINLTNTSIDGKFLFSGSATRTKPVNEDGSYNGNDEAMMAFIGSGIQQQYNITGADLLFGEETQTQRKITTNMAISNSVTNESLSGSDTIEEMMGLGAGAYSFYIRGTDSHGTSFKEQIDIPNPSIATVDALLSDIENLYGQGMVNVSLNDVGQIVIEDKFKGSSKIDFHMIGSDDNDYSNLTAASNIKEFISSGLTSAPGVGTPDAAVYDRTQFGSDSNILTSNVSQIVKPGMIDINGNEITNNFAVDSTRLGAVASGTTFDPDPDGNPHTKDSRYTGLDGQVIHLEGIDVNGAAFNVDINLFDGGSTVSGSANFNINDVNGNPVDAGRMTYRQLMDVVNMIVTDDLPTAYPTYEDAIKASNAKAETSLSHDGKITFLDRFNTSTSATISLYDANSSDFTNNVGSVLTFNTNNALSIRDPKTNFFSILDEAIYAVREGRLNADGSVSDEQRNTGIQNALQKLDDLMDHVTGEHTQAGAQSNALEYSIERNEILILNSEILRSEVLDTDVAEATMHMNQLMLNMQAIYSMTTRVSQLSLVNYL